MRKRNTRVFTVDEVSKALLKFIGEEAEDTLLDINPKHIFGSMKSNEELIEVELLEKKNED